MSDLSSTGGGQVIGKLESDGRLRKSSPGQTGGLPGPLPGPTDAKNMGKANPILVQSHGMLNPIISMEIVLREGASSGYLESDVRLRKSSPARQGPSPGPCLAS